MKHPTCTLVLIILTEDVVSSWSLSTGLFYLCCLAVLRIAHVKLVFFFFCNPKSNILSLAAMSQLIRTFGLPGLRPSSTLIR
ncbi:hypothetical protein NMG60_11018275 [Bertholletia excelsa]